MFLCRSKDVQHDWTAVNYTWNFINCSCCQTLVCTSCTTQYFSHWLQRYFRWVPGEIEQLPFVQRVIKTRQLMIFISKKKIICISFAAALERGKGGTENETEEEWRCLAEVPQQSLRCIYGYNFAQITWCSNAVLPHRNINHTLILTFAIHQ